MRKENIDLFPLFFCHNIGLKKKKMIMMSGYLFLRGVLIKVQKIIIVGTQIKLTQILS